VRILVIEDEPKLAKAVKEGLETDDYSVSLSHSGEDGFYQLCQGQFDLAILDVMLPGRDGFEILKSVRQMGVLIPILLLTARDAVEDRVRGLDIGADDYLVKPFAFPELQARVRALLRRGGFDGVAPSRLGDLEIDIPRRSVTRGGQRIELTAKEFEILEYLFRHRGHVVSREMLVRDVWKEPSRQTPLDNVIDVHVNHLRKKLDDNYKQKLLHTVRGMGFVLRAEEA
jgi:DNA-binding response OmpR family regulator